MAIISTRITVGTTPTLLVAPSVQHQRVQLLNAGTVVVRIGGPDVTTTAYGLPALPNNPDVARTPFSFDLNPNESIFGIVASGTSAVNVWVQRP
jgi:hypothetical protein